MTASQLWDAFETDGSLSSLPFHNSPSSTGEIIGAAVCQRFVLEPWAKKEIVFSLSWDIPYVRFGSGKVLPPFSLNPPYDIVIHYHSCILTTPFFFLRHCHVAIRDILVGVATLLLTSRSMLAPPSSVGRLILINGSVLCCLASACLYSTKFVPPIYLLFIYCLYHRLPHHI